MGHVRTHRPVLAIVAAFSRYEEALHWARERAESTWGPVALESPQFDFSETRFYQATMGTDLKKMFFAFSRLMDPADLAARKLLANQWETECSHQKAWTEPRPLNLDPGYLTEAKLVLASTKDRDHRIYLQDGIFAEVTLFFQGKTWQSRPWTYPDYQRADYHQFFDRCRTYLRRRYREDEPSP